MKIKMLLLIGCIGMTLASLSQDSKKYNYLISKGKSEDQQVFRGRVLDSNENGIPFANIGIRGTLFGTAANVDGFFVLKLPKSFEEDTVSISCIGFKTVRVSIADMKKRYQYVLTDDISDLGEIQIESERVSARDVIKKVIESIKRNYRQEPYTQFKLYQLKLKDLNDRFVMYEKVMEEYDEDGYQATPMYGLKKKESFRLNHMARIGNLDTLQGAVTGHTNSQQDIPTATAWADVVNARFNSMLSKSKQRKYEFQFNERGLHSADTIFIDFSITNPGHRSTTAIGPIKFSGTILIDQNSYAVLEIHSNAIIDKDKVWRSKHNPAYTSEDVWWEKEIITYREINGQYYFSNLIRRTNYDMDKKGFLEIIGLDVIPGQRAYQEEIRRPLFEYDSEKWSELTTLEE